MVLEKGITCSGFSPLPIPLDLGLLTAYRRRRTMGEERDRKHDNEAEEALSLRDLPISSGSADARQEERRCSTSLSDLGGFEFAKGATGELCAADDVFWPSGDGIFPWSCSVAKDRDSLRGRPEGLPSKPASKPDPLVRVSSESRIELRDQHGGCRKLERASRSVGYGERLPPSRLRWRLFGPVKAPEIELKDLRCRQNRRIQAGPYAECGNGEGKTTGKGEREMTEDRRVRWKLIRALSCNGNESTVVSPSLVRMQQACGPRCEQMILTVATGTKRCYCR